MSSSTGLIFSYIIGLTFLVGGVIFLLFLDDNRFLFGIPYTLVGLFIVVGIHMSMRRRKKKAAAAGDGDGD
jgi:hypothetical protein